MCTHTHSYADERIQTLLRLDRLTPHSRFQKWKAVTKSEMKGFFSAVIESYWKTSWVSEVPFFRMLMPRDRFQEIFWMLHVSHSDPCRPAKKIDKIKQLLQLLLPKFREHYYPTENLAIDETMVGFRGCFGSLHVFKKEL